MADDLTPGERSARALERIADRLDEIAGFIRPKPSSQKRARQLALDDPQDAVIALPCSRGDTFFVYQYHVDTFEGAYTLVDVPQTLKEVNAWLVANPDERWTLRGCLRGVNRWLSQEQNRLATQRARAVQEVNFGARRGS